MVCTTQTQTTAKLPYSAMSVLEERSALLKEVVAFSEGHLSSSKSWHKQAGS